MMHRRTEGVGGRFALRAGLRLLGPLALVAVIAGSLAAVDLHFELKRSSPEAEKATPSPAAIELWFSQSPQINATSIRLIDPEGELVETGPVTPDAEDVAHQSVVVDGPLAPGVYRVAWRSMGADGHVVRDQFAFTVTVTAP